MSVTVNGKPLVCVRIAEAWKSGKAVEALQRQFGLSHRRIIENLDAAGIGRATRATRGTELRIARCRRIAAERRTHATLMLPLEQRRQIATDWALGAEVTDLANHFGRSVVEISAIIEAMANWPRELPKYRPPPRLIAPRLVQAAHP